MAETTRLRGQTLLLLLLLDVCLGVVCWLTHNVNDSLHYGYMSSVECCTFFHIIFVFKAVCVSLDLLRIEKTSGDVVRERMKCAINRVLIGKVNGQPHLPTFFFVCWAIWLVIVQRDWLYGRLVPHR